ncbi:MAG: FprA family A-type flavoprotein [Muribaculaceae bacterium]|nr:FprA family A-type flavoprotein [Muribaculaceae bacterium]
MILSELNKGIYYVGVNDRTSSLFESLWSLPAGVSYNSYIVKGDKTALIDTVHISKAKNFIANIKTAIGESPIDYVVINHMEPDHSGAIDYIVKSFPDVTIVGNKKTIEMVEGFYGSISNTKVINDGDVLDLGDGKSLKFVITPMVHWPETMMTFEQSSSTLFSGDAFGCFGALNGGVIDAECDVESYIPEMYRYYAAIVAKYGTFVIKAIEKLKGLRINRICPTHGPVWQDYMMHVIDLYDRLAHFTPQNGAVIVYGSMYGNTEDIAELIARELTVNGVSVRMHNIATADLSVVLADIMRFKGLIIGAPTYNSSIFPPIQNLIEAIVSRGIKNRVLSTFGSYTWGPGISVKIEKSFESLNYDTVSCKIEMKQSILDNDLYNRIEEFAKVFAEKVK